MNFIELAKSRYSVRKYQDKKVEPEKIQKILEAGRIAPTAANKQPQRFIVIKEEEGFNKLKKAANTYSAPLVIITCSDHSVTWKRPFDGKDTADIDASIVTDHMMLQASELGLGSVWICYFDIEVLKKEFNLPKNLEPINILAIGYAEGEAASPDRHSTQRKPIDELVIGEF